MTPVFNTFKLGRAFGIDVLLHWSFLLLPLLIVAVSISQGDSLQLAALRMAFLFVILGSVLLHEIGHALAARCFSIPTQDIILTPVCGLARLQHAPATPWQEIAVAVAGPLTNCVIAMAMGGIILAFGGSLQLERDLFGDSFWVAVFWVNALLFLLNLLPIFPMDGGRVLRALMAQYWNGTKATWVAARLGQLTALALACIGAYQHNLALVVIGAFLILAAQEEVKNLRLRLAEHRPD